MIKMIISGKEFHDLEKLKKSLHIDEVCNEAELKGQLAKGNNVYAYICPYDSEIHETNTLHWKTNKDEALDNYYVSNDEI